MKISKAMGMKMRALMRDNAAWLMKAPSGNSAMPRYPLTTSRSIVDEATLNRAGAAALRIMWRPPNTGPMFMIFISYDAAFTARFANRNMEASGIANK
jgi:hypothetical protein